MLNDVQTKVEKCKLQLSQQPFLTITHITSLIIFNIYTDVHKIHSKRRFFFSSFSMQLNPLVHSEPSEKSNTCILIKKECSLGASAFVPHIVYQLVANQVHPRTCNRRVWLTWWHSLSQFHFSHFSQHQNDILTHQNKIQMLFSFSVSNQLILLINRQTWDKKQKRV